MRRAFLNQSTLSLILVISLAGAACSDDGGITPGGDSAPTPVDQGAGKDRAPASDQAPQADAKGCSDQCTAGAKQCSGSGVAECKKMASGCTDWDTPVPCKSGQFCSGGKCVTQCLNQCTLAAKQCSGSGVAECKKMASGCTDWDTAVPCKTGEICSGGKCVTQCLNQCTLAAKQCSGSGVAECKKMASGCTDWDTAVPCKSGEICSGGKCVTQCLNQCTAGAKQCSGAGVAECKKMASGCTDWDTAVPCKTGEICSGGKCVSKCTNQCTLSSKQCSGSGVAECKKMASGCTDWDTAVPCASSQFCSGGVCVSQCTNQCTAGVTRCSGTGTQLCKKMTSGCTDWDTATPCPTGQVCKLGKCAAPCTNLCTLGTKQCSGGGVSPCEVKASGCTGWGTSTACPTGTSCFGGSCLKGSLVITKNTELCGEQSFSGDFTIQGGAKVTCKTGDLTVKAKNIFIDPSSSIDLSGSSSSASGAKFNVCSRGSCYADNGRTGAGGGGNGSAGTTSSKVNHSYRSGQYGSCSCRYCWGAAGGPARDDRYHLQVSMGGMGGQGCRYVNTYGSSLCYAQDLLTGGQGGGAVRLLATNKITILGKVLANGAQGLEATKATSAGTGGGAGGSILLIAPSLSITGALSAAGAAGGLGGTFTNYCYSTGQNQNGGAGGQGRIKILHGDSYSNSGSIAAGAVQEIDRMPPVLLTSTTHPDQKRYYNDRAASLALAWTKPYAGAIGTWYLLSNSANTQLTPTNGTYTTGTSVTLPTTALTKTGVWYLHLLTVHSTAKASTVANRYRVNVNATPHAVSSSSHPDQSAWYTGASKKTLTFSWKHPASAVPASSFKGYWYRLDKVSATAAPASPAAAASGWTFTANSQVLLQKDHAGAALSDWTYYLHLVAEDTMGNLTTLAAHYRVQLGPAPTKMNLYGYVRDSVGTALKGAALKLEPYGMTATTDKNGYFLIKDAYQGVYALSVGLAGYKTLTRSLKADGAAAMPFTFVLKK